MIRFGLTLQLSLCLASGLLSAEPPRRPNIIFILADDLGYGDVGCFGQKIIRTPHVDQLAGDGMRLTNHYSGSNVCAPSRCVLMTGLHPGHAFIRDNRQARGYEEGQMPVPDGTLQLPLKLKSLGYAVGGFGKWGLGPVGSSGDPFKQGFDRWFGYNCQAVAHNYYPTHLWDNDRKSPLNNPPFPAHQKLPPEADPNDPASYTRYLGKDYAPDLIIEQALSYIRTNKDRPFFLYFASTVPHLALQVPADSLKEYLGQFEDAPYRGDRAYLPHRYPRAAYAAMITRLDRDVGRLLSLIKECGLERETIVIFSSDNGPLYDRLGGTDTEFFNSASGMRGRKGSFYEGGIRVPCIIRWPGKIAPLTTHDRVTGFEDWLPTLLELIDAKSAIPEGLDGISFAPALLGQPQSPRSFLYRESPGYGGQQSIRVGPWKAIRRNLNPGPRAREQQPGELELYHLERDPSETKDVAKENPEVADRLRRLMAEQHVKSEPFSMKGLDVPGQ